jgi:hypothetical protein
LTVITQSPGYAYPTGYHFQTENRSNAESFSSLDVFDAHQTSQVPLVLQGQLNSGDLFLAAAGKVGYGPMSDLTVFAERISKKVTGVSPGMRSVYIHQSLP